MSGKSFVSIDNIVGSILLEIGDEQNHRYYTKASQWAIDAYRRTNIFMSPFYLERKITLDPDLFYGTYPKDLIKLIAVGIYRNGVFFPFQKQTDMAMMPPDVEDGIYSADDVDTESVPEFGFQSSYKGSNIGYWMDDPEQCRFYVRNYQYSTYNSGYSDTTSDITAKVVIRYKTTGIDCGNELCVPTEARDMIIAQVVYKFMRKNIPFQVTADEKDRQEREVDARVEEYQALMYEPLNFWQVKDAVYGSLNTTARR